MSNKLRKSHQIWKLAVDLGLEPGSDPVSAILKFCEQKVRRVLRKYKCSTLPELLSALACVLGTRFIEAHSDADLENLRNEYLALGETGFATLGENLGPNTFAVTLKLVRRRKWQPPYISVIDCRGDKKWRRYYSKWHELAHLLTLTDQMRLCFTRTHSQTDGTKDPEEALMEVIAGSFGFWKELVAPYAKGLISFESIDRLRAEACPEASSQASLIGIVSAWPSPCILVQAGLGLKKSVRDLLSQGAFQFIESPVPELRALKVTTNDAAQKAGIVIYANMRIPQRSVIHRVFSGESSTGEAVEDLGWWTTSENGKLSDRRVLIRAQRFWDSVQALITPF